MKRLPSRLTAKRALVTDNRSAGRSNVFLGAVLHGGAGSDQVRVRNISALGALVEGSGLPPVGTSIRLVRGPLHAAGQIAWVNAGQAGLNFERPVEVEAWVKRTGHAGQQRVDDLVAAVRHRASIETVVRAAEAPSIGEISAGLHEVCQRMAAMPDTSIEFGEELLKLDALAQQLGRIASRL